MTADPIIDPRNGRLISVYDLSRETGVPAYIIWYRYDTQGVRSESLLAPKGAPIDMVKEQREAWSRYLRFPAGILATHRLGEYAKAQRQHQRSEAA